MFQKKKPKNKTKNMLNDSLTTQKCSKTKLSLGISTAAKTECFLTHKANIAIFATAQHNPAVALQMYEIAHEITGRVLCSTKTTLN